jgi:hypothetical protein
MVRSATFPINGSRAAQSIPRSDTVSEGSSEYEYRDAEYEYEKKHEQSIGLKFSIERF